MPRYTEAVGEGGRTRAFIRGGKVGARCAYGRHGPRLSFVKVRRTFNAFVAWVLYIPCVARLTPAVSQLL